MRVDWATLTQEQARRRIGAASKAEQAAARRFNDGKGTEADWLAAFTLWEDLRVYALTGEKPE